MSLKAFMLLLSVDANPESNDVSCRARHSRCSPYHTQSKTSGTDICTQASCIDLFHFSILVLSTSSKRALSILESWEESSSTQITTSGSIKNLEKYLPLPLCKILRVSLSFFRIVVLHSTLPPSLNHL